MVGGDRASGLREMSEPQTSLWRSGSIRWLAVLTMLGFTSFFLTLSSLPFWAAERGWSLTAAGSLISVMLVCTVMFQLVVPAAVRRWGALLVLAAGLALLSLPSLGYLVDVGFVWVLAISAVRGAGFSMVTVVTVTMFGLLVSQDRRSEGIGVHGLAVNVPNLVALPLGVTLAEAEQFDQVAVLAAAPVLVFLAWPRIARVLATPPQSDPDARMGRGLSGLSGVLAPALVLLSVCAVVAGYLTLLPIELSGSSAAGWLLLAFGLTAMVVRWRIGSLADRRGLGGLIPGSLGCVAAGFSAVALGLHLDSMALLVGGSLVAGLGYGGTQNLTLVSSFNRAGQERLMVASAAWNMSFDSGLAVGAVTVGTLAHAGLGIAGALGACALALLAGWPLARIATRPLCSGNDKPSMM